MSSSLRTSANIGEHHRHPGLDPGPAFLVRAAWSIWLNSPLFDPLHGGRHIPLPAREGMKGWVLLQRLDAAEEAHSRALSPFARYPPPAPPLQGGETAPVPLRDIVSAIVAASTT